MNKYTLNLCRNYLDNEGMWQLEVEDIIDFYGTEEEVQAKCAELLSKYDYVSYTF